MSSKVDQKTQSISDALVIEKPIEKVPEVEGINTALSMLAPIVARLNSSVITAKNAEASVNDEIAAIKADEKSFRVLNLVSPEWETTIRANGIAALQKGVTDEIKAISTQLNTIATLATSLQNKYGIVTPTVKEADKGMKGGKITAAVKAHILNSVEYSEFREKFSPTFTELPDGTFLIHGTGHPRGNNYTSNLRNW